MMYHTDVLVVGGGCAGAVAAVAAARNGARTMLVDRGGFVGGTSTAILDTFYAFYTPGERPEKVVSGLPDEVVARVERYDAVLRRPNTYGAGMGITYNPETLKRVWDDLIVESGIRLLLHSFVFDAIVEGKQAGGGPSVDGRVAGGRVTGVRLANKGGVHEVRARAVVDASGDADVVARADGAYELAGRDSPQQTLTTTFRMGGVDPGKAFSFSSKEFHAMMREANESGEYHLPREEGSAHRTPIPGVVATILTRVPGVDIEDAEALTAAEVEGRRQVAEYVRFMKGRVPGYKDAYLMHTSPWIGIRETRRVIGDYVLRAEDVLAARPFPDAIARCGAPIEDHHGGKDTRWVYIPDGETYGIPYRCLLPSGLEGVLVAGRCLSATHDAHASARSMGTCMAMGQAAGTAAALAAVRGTTPRALPSDDLQATLDAQGADFGQRTAPAGAGQ